MKSATPLRLLLALCVLSSAAIFSPLATSARAEIKAEATAGAALEVSLDSVDWNYRLGQPATFTIKVVRGGAPLADARVRYRVGPDMMPGAWTTATVPEGGLKVDGGTLQVPGFIRLIAELDQPAGEKKVEMQATAGFEPEKIRATQTMPADFEQFWAAGLAELARVPLEPEITPMPKLSNSKINVYHVGIRTAGPDGARVYGILSEPKAPGKYPAVLNLPGAGVRGYTGNRQMAADGFITLEIGIHGVPVNNPASFYEELNNGALKSYRTAGLEDPKTYYFRRVYLACVRANDFLASRENWDGKTLFAVGGSQGGQLSIATAVLDPRVKAVAVFYPAFSDVTGYLHGRAGGWPHMFRARDDGSPGYHSTPAKIATSGYFDTVNFARRLTVPGFYSWGYNDTVCPPTSMHAAYNEITAPKELYVAKGAGHRATPEQTRRRAEWLRARVGLLP
jgi:cephalosporin-C deacetylase-like acetyl esterase